MRVCVCVCVFVQDVAYAGAAGVCAMGWVKCTTALWAMSRLAVHGAYRRSACQGFGSACVLTWRHVANWQPLASRLSREKYCYG